MKIKPIRDRVLVKPIEADTVTASGIVIPETAKEKPMKGLVLAVGSGKVTETGTTIEMTVQEKQTVMFNKYSGQSIKVDNEDLVILKEDEILAIIE